MRLKITTPPGAGFKPGNAASIFLDDVDVSKYVNRVVLTVDADDAIHADVRFFLTSADVDVPAEIMAALSKEQSSGVLGGHNRQKVAQPVAV